MRRASASWRALRARERGATAVEYAVMVALIAAVIVLAVAFLGQRSSASFSCIGTAISARTACGSPPSPPTCCD